MNQFRLVIMCKIHIITNVNYEKPPAGFLHWVEQEKWVCHKYHGVGCRRQVQEPMDSSIKQI